MYLQVRAKRKLEQMLMQEQDKIEAIFNTQQGAYDSKQGDQGLLINLLREEISKMEETTDKTVMQKTLDRKSFRNQKEYAFKIFAEIGLLQRLGLK